MPKRSSAQWKELGRDLRTRVAAFAPDWTEPTGSDPGMTLVEVFAFLGEELLSRGDLSPRARTRLDGVLAVLRRRAGEPDCQDGTLTRPAFVTGRLLTADDLTAEQAYHRSKQRRHARLLHGVGIVDGLAVSVDGSPSGGEPSIVVSPGVAIGPDGDELVLCAPATRDLLQSTTAAFVSLLLAERPTEPGTDGEHGRVEESADVVVSSEVPPGALPLARVRRNRGAWRVDPSFAAPRSR